MKKIMLLAAILASAVLLASCTAASENVDNTGTGETGDTTEFDGTTDSAGTESAITFTSTDINGDDVDDSIFAKYKLTMINIWATTCGYCISEMPDLAEISDDYADKGFQIIGIPTDVSTNNGVFSGKTFDSAKDIITETGVNYINVLPSDSVKIALLNSVIYVPTTIFVDENGNQVGDEYIGSKSKSQWTEIIDSLLEEVS